MVVFTCQNCGDSLQKPKVEKHYNSRCRNRDVNLTCVDCLKDFFGQDYVSHTKCVTEMERYSANGTVIKENKGQKKQDRFVEMIPNLLNSKNLTIGQRKLLEVCSKFDNVPRKRPKFRNFILNAAKSIKLNSDDVDSVFDILENALKELNQSVTNKQEATDNTSINDKSSVIEATETHENMPVDSTLNELKTKTKKKKDKVKHSSVELSLSIEKEDCVEPEEETKENVNELSKKKLKKQKKYEKYLAELENEAKQDKVENEKCEENMELDQSFDENHKKSKKKSKKYQAEQLDSKLNQQENGNESANAMQVVSENTERKKSKKRRLDEPICDVTEKKSKGAAIEDDEPTSQGTFDWADVITRVLVSRPDKELSLKRLGKKVIDEYQTVKSDHRSYEELLAKFNKKVKKVKGVKVLKDKAKLTEEC
uniref:Uncharacterized protein n=1 Tax=Cuerna arida TaxID=1464854 RepID=A0A1B6GV65_9HEMI